MGHGLSCSEAFVIFSQQRSNPCLLHWQVDSLPLSHQGSPVFQNQVKKKEVVINKQRIDPLDDKLVLLKYNEACSQIGFITNLLPYCYFKQQNLQKPRAEGFKDKEMYVFLDALFLCRALLFSKKRKKKRLN